MNLYDACAILDLWYAIKARAQMWSISNCRPTSLDEVRILVKNRFKELALQHHPDKGGDNSKYLEIQEAYELIKSASVPDFIHALSIEAANNIKYYTPGSQDCANCSKWSDVVCVCVTTTCTGFKQHEKSICNKFGLKQEVSKGIQGSSFLSGGSQELGNEAS